MLQAGLTRAEVRQRLEKAYSHTFDLASPPFMQCTIAPLGPDCHIVFLLMHHILMDGWSAGKLWVDIMGLYTAALTDSPPVLPELTVHFGDYAAWERKQIEPGTAIHDKMLAYWESKLRLATPIVQLPYDHPRVLNDIEKPPVALGCTLDAPTVAALKSMAAKLKVSLYSVCLAAYRLMLCEYGATDDVVIASSYSIRPPGTENLVGLFLHIFV